jgi:FkbM family methyltransferase
MSKSQDDQPPTHRHQSVEMNAVASYSQWAEDVLVLDFFGHRAEGTFFEAGAHHPTLISQTYLLEQHGWRGVLVEALGDKAAEFAHLRPRSRFFRKALGSPEQRGKTLDFVVPPNGNKAEARLLAPGKSVPDGAVRLHVESTTISDVLEEAGITQLDYLSLDIEGHELEALRGLDFNRWLPRLILVEDHIYNLKLHRFLKSKCYQLVYRTGSNNWYVPLGTPFPKLTLKVRLELFRKLYLSMPFRKLRLIGRKLRGLPA